MSMENTTNQSGAEPSARETARPQWRIWGLALALCGVAALATGFGARPPVVLVAFGGFGAGFGMFALLRGPWGQDLTRRDRRAVHPAALPARHDPARADRVDAGVQDLFDRLPVALLRLGGDGVVIQSNAVARQLLGLEPGETPRFETLVEGLGRSVDAWLQVARDNHEVLKPEVVQARRRQGEAILQVTLMPPPIEDDSGLIAVLSDATKLKTLEAQFVQSQKMQAIGQLAGGVAHDFNNLLTAISGYCDLLLLRHDKNDPDYSDLTQIAQNANRAASLVAHLLAFSRKQTLTPKVVSVNTIVSDMGHLLNRLLGEKVTLSTEYARDLPSAFVDPRQLEQVIMNLVLNARDAMPDGGEVRVTTDLWKQAENARIASAMVPRGTYVLIRVEDTGVGIAAEHVDKIFEPFFSTKAEGKGTGLGLSMVYGIIKQTGGFIFCDSKPGQGTEFRLLLPAHDGTVRVAEPVKTGKSRPTELGGQIVLLVEDEAPVRAFAMRALRMHGMRVIEADCAEAALEKLSDPDLHIDLVISDEVMPGMDGPSWVQQALETRPDLRVIFVSGYAEESFAGTLPDLPGAAFLPKPFSLTELVDKVRELTARG